MGLMIGALFGGLLIGVIITSGIAYLMHRRSRYSIDKRYSSTLLHVSKIIKLYMSRIHPFLQLQVSLHKLTERNLE